MQQQQSAAPAVRLFTPKQAARYAAVSVSTLYRAGRRGELKFLHLGRSARIARIDLDAWIDAQARAGEAAR